jgi:hypothetical protein
MDECQVGELHEIEFRDFEIVMMITPDFQTILLNEDIKGQDRITKLMKIDIVNIDRNLSVAFFHNKIRFDGMPRR